MTTPTPEEIPVHPVQRPLGVIRDQSVAPQVVTMAAYEVYTELWGAQERLVTGDCRGGFGAGELIGLLYARSFPRKEWRQRFEEAMKGMEYL